MSAATPSSPPAAAPPLLRPARVRIGLSLNLQMGFSRQVLRGIRQFAWSRPDWRLVLLSDTGRADAGALPGADVAGLIGIFHQNPLQKELYDAVRRHFPERAISISSYDAVSELPRVLVDNAAAGRGAADYFAERGFRRVAYVSDAWHGAHAGDALRRDGFFARAQERGLAFDGEDPASPLRGFRHGDDAQVGCFCFNDRVARLLMEELLINGLHIPEDVALLGMDNDELENLLCPLPLSSLRSDWQRVGFLAAEQLALRLEGTLPGREPLLLVPPTGVEERASTQPPQSDDPRLRRCLRILREEITRLRDVPSFARRVGIGRRSLEILFQEQLGRGVGESLRRTRLDFAKTLLRETGLPIAEIADRAGYVDSRSLSREFRKLEDQTPGQYRRRHGA